MKILLLSNVLSVHTVKWVKALSNIHDIFIFSLSEPSTDDLKDIEGLNYQTAGISDSNAQRENAFQKLNYLKALPIIKKIIRQFRPDILHAHYATSYGLIGALSGFHPFILSVWGADVYDFPSKSFLHKLLLKFNLCKADIILSTSHVMAEQTKKFTGKTVLVTPFGIDLQRFKKKREDVTSKGDELVIGTVKTLHKKYGIAYLIRAFKILTDKYLDKNMKLVIVGGGPDEHELKQLSIDLGVDNKTLFTGKISQDRVPEYLNMFDVYVAVSVLDSESFGVAIIEASACEVPVVVSNVGGLTEVVDDGKTGYIVPPKDAEKTADAIGKLLESELIRSEFGKQGRKKVEELYNWDENVKLMNSIYDTCLKNKCNS